MRQQPYNLHYQQITKFYYQILLLKYWHNLQQNHPAQTPSSVLRQLSSERKFANGAITGAFSRVFNDEVHRKHKGLNSRKTLKEAKEAIDATIKIGQK